MVSKKFMALLTEFEKELGTMGIKDPHTDFVAQKAFSILKECRKDGWADGSYIMEKVTKITNEIDKWWTHPTRVNADFCGKCGRVRESDGGQSWCTNPQCKVQNQKYPTPKVSTDFLARPHYNKCM